MMKLYSPCLICPRKCGVDRLAGETGYCGEGAILRIGTAVIHRGEEPPLIGTGGSGTIFLSGCNLGCVFCQNYQVSQGDRGEPPLGKAVSAYDFADICVMLESSGAENINIVTGSHAVPGIIEGFNAARKKGVEIPFLWNSSGYDSQEALILLKEHIDIFLPDIKTLDKKISSEFFNAPDYPDAAKAAVLKMIEIMHEKNPYNAQDKVIIRHLILPGYLESTHSVLRWFAENAKDRALLSLMTQYTPVLRRDKPSLKNAPKRYVNKEDYETVMSWLEEFKIEDGFCQELVTGSEWLPDFRRINPFPSKLSVPVWSCVT